MFDVNIKIYHLQESDPSVHEGTSPTTSTACMDESLSGNIDPVQEEDIDCHDKYCYNKQREAALFLLQLKEKAKIPQSVIDNVVDGTTGLLKKSIQRLKRRVTEFLVSEGQDDLKASTSFQDIWQDEITPFEGLETQHHQEEYMKQSFPYVVCVRGYLTPYAAVSMYYVKYIILSSLVYWVITRLKMFLENLDQLLENSLYIYNLDLSMEYFLQV